MQSGEAFTIWTFNEQVYTNRFSPQIWSRDQRQPLAERTAQFIRNQRFEKRTRIERVMPELSKVSAAPDRLRIFLFSDGDTSLAGTPFDRSINLAYAQHGRTARKARTPLVTLLSVRGGRMVA